MSEVTNENQENEDNNSDEYLVEAFIFAKALLYTLRPNEGIIIDIPGEEDEFIKAVVYEDKGRIIYQDYDGESPEGRSIRMTESPGENLSLN